MADRIVIMRDGRIEQVGEPAEVYQRPVSRFTASFLGAANFFRGRVTANKGGALSVAVKDGPLFSVRAERTVESEVTIALRPEAVGITLPGPNDNGHSANTTRAVVEQVIYHGFVTHLHLRLPNGDPLSAFRQHGAGLDGLPINPGMQVAAHWPADAAQIVRDDLDG
jgi:ABC-type Fe3+/spermidine/putrescine transport system ATPase subunit